MKKGIDIEWECYNCKNNNIKIGQSKRKIYADGIAVFVPNLYTCLNCGKQAENINLFIKQDER